MNMDFWDNIAQTPLLSNKLELYYIVDSVTSMCYQIFG